MPRGADGTHSLQAYPNIRAAASILGVAPSTLSRRADLHAEARGERDRVLPASEILRLAAVFRKRSLNDVAYDVLEHARAAAPDEVQRVENEVEAFFEGNAVHYSEQREELVTLAHRLLPADLCTEIEAALERTGSNLPECIQGWPPLPKD